MNIWWILLILLVVSLAISAIGFKRFIWFLSVGYGLSICGVALATMIILACIGKLDIISLIACIILVCYGFRLGGFLLIRELKNAAYRKTLDGATKTDKPIPVFVKIFIWVFVAILYVAEVSGVLFGAYYAEPNVGSGFLSMNWFELAGVIVMVVAATIEAVADYEKSKYKKINPHMAATKGLYRIQRCPNYYGETIVWTGVLVYFLSTCFPFVATWPMFVCVILAWISIVYIMLNGAKRLEKRQEKSYGELEEFKEYTKKTPLIYLICIPIHSLKNSKIVK